MVCMNTSFNAITYPFKHNMCLSCYLRYILPSEIESFLKATAFIKDLAVISCL